MAEYKPNPAHENAIPPAVARQAARADAAQRAALGLPEPSEAPGEPEAVPPSNVTHLTPPAPVAPPAAAPSPVPAPTEDAEAQLRAERGRVAAERERNTQLAAQIANLERMVRELQQAQVKPAPTPAPAYAKLVTPEEEADYGTDLLAVVGKRARDEVAGEMASLREEITSLRATLNTVGGTVYQQQERTLVDHLAAAVPGWAEQNADPAFLAWLAQPEPWSGIKRQDLLLNAFSGQNAPLVIKYFQGYLDEAAATGQRPQPTPTTVPAAAAAGKVPLETYAAPGRAAPPLSAPAPAGQKAQYTRAQISQFFTEKAAGKWRGRDADAQAIEADIFRAGPEGRVVG